MKNVARSLVLGIALLATPVLVHATSSLSFVGGGYWLNMEIGHDDRPAVASITFHAPGDAQGVLLRGNYQVVSFDTDRRELIIEYKGSDARVEPFVLAVRGDKAILRVGGARIESLFSWLM
jgi:hypothetical protein